jgi:hypothetical protein
MLRPVAMAMALLVLTGTWAVGQGIATAGTPVETDAVNWAVGQIGSTSFGDLCLEFVQYAYQKGANFDIESQTNYGDFNGSTYPQEVWNAGFKSGTTGGSSTVPPYGALVFYNASGPGASDPADYSHVTIMGSGGEMVSTNDVVNENEVHSETMAQVTAAHPWNTYVGWWLPDGSSATPPPAQPGSVVIPTDVNNDHRDDLIEITPRGAVGFNVVPLLSTGKKFRYGGPWYYDTQHTIADTKFVTGDFTGNGRDDLAVITPRGAVGFNIVVLLSTKTGFKYDNVWYADTQHTLADTDFVVGHFTRDGRDDIAEITPRGAVGLNIVPLMSTGKKFAYGNLWYDDPDQTLDSTVFVPGQFTNNGLTDIAEITPRQGVGFNIVPLMSTGKKFAYGNLWFDDTQHALADTDFVVGQFTRDGRDDIAEITPRGAVGLNIVPLMSTGKKFAYGNLWWPDTTASMATTEFVPGQFTRDGRDDIAEITPRGAVGLNIVPLMSTGSKFAYGGLWYEDPNADLITSRII